MTSERPIVACSAVVRSCVASELEFALELEAGCEFGFWFLGLSRVCHILKTFLEILDAARNCGEPYAVRGVGPLAIVNMARVQGNVQVTEEHELVLTSKEMVQDQ